MKVRDVAAARFTPRPERTIRRDRSRPQPLPLLFALLLGALCCARAANATSIVARRTATDIVVGAESRVTSIDKEPRPDRCKIFRVGPREFVTNSGVGSDAFNIPQLVTVAIAYRDDRRLSLRWRRVDKLVAQGLRMYLRAVRKTDPGAYRTLEAMTSVVQTLVFGTTAVGTPFMHMHEFAVRKGTAQVTVRRASCPPCVGDGGLVVGLGDCSSVVPRRIAAGRFIERDTPGVVADVRSALLECLGLFPVSSGPPLSILHLGANGAEWIEAGKCEPD